MLKHDHAIAHMESAHNYAALSHCIRKKVGCLIVKVIDGEQQIISVGVNGTLPGDENCCEGDDGLTHDETFHAEEAAIAKLAKSTHSSQDAIAFITCEPCKKCARLLARAGIKFVYFDEIYPKLKGEGIEYLVKRNIPVMQLTTNS